MRRYAAPTLGLPRISLGLIPKGYAGTRKTVQQIMALIRSGAKDFYVRQIAIDILFAKAVNPKDYWGEIKALFEWVQRHIRYTKDPFRVEVLHSARRLLELRAGDCDDMTILLGAMLEAIGHPVRLVLTGPDPGRPLLFTHIYLEAHYQGRWIPLDATMPHAMGWAPRTAVKRRFALRRSPSRSPAS
jgi:transglutaminase-like putative cysteine protease